MRRLTLLLLLLSTAAVSQQTIKMTQVTAVVQGPNGIVYAGCQWSVVLSPGPSGATSPGQVLGGQQGQCDALGNLSVSLADNLLTISPGGSQWSFSICSAPGLVGGPYCKSNILVTVTGTTQNLTSTFDAVLPSVPGSISSTGLTYSSPTLTVSTAGGGSGVLALSGTTSGTATITAPAVAGTSTNPIAFGNVLQAPNGASTTSSYGFSADQTMGISYATQNGGTLALMNGSQSNYGISKSFGIQIANIWPIMWVSTGNQLTGTIDTNINRGAAGVVCAGITNGAPDCTGTFGAASFQSRGTTFTSSGGLGDTTLVGGATAGKFTTVTVTSGSTVITMGNSATAPHGWHCNASDITHPADIIVGTSASVTTATLTVATAITAGDILEFSCVGY
jgi:hypothetical protein